MKLVKLDAIGSTNDFLKVLSQTENVENFTVVTAENQTNGRGQMGASWKVEAGKNLTTSIFVRDFIEETAAVFNLNIVFSVSVIEALETFGIPDLHIKWPNDILSGNKKIGGILIENSIKSDGEITSVIGFGLNVNQTNFEDLPKASSLAAICESTFDKEVILFSVMEYLEKNIQLWEQTNTLLRAFYIQKLFKKGVPMPFQNQDGNRFMAIVHGVSDFGKLQLQLEDDSICEFDIKEIQMLY